MFIEPLYLSLQLVYSGILPNINLVLFTPPSPLLFLEMSTVQIEPPSYPCTCHTLDRDSMNDEALLADLLRHGVPSSPLSRHEQERRIKREQYLETRDICCASSEEDGSFHCRRDHHKFHKGREALARKLRSALQVIDKALSMFRLLLHRCKLCLLFKRPNEIALCFNGGKDCTVLLHLLHYIMQTRGVKEGLGELLILYFVTPNNFPEINQFVIECSTR